MISVTSTSRKMETMSRLCGVRPQGHGIVVFALDLRYDAAERAGRGESDM